MTDVALRLPPRERGPNARRGRGIDGRAVEPVEPDERRADDRRRRELHEPRSWSDVADAALDRCEELLVGRSEDAPAQDDVEIEPPEPQAPDQGRPHRYELGGKPIDDRPRDRIAVGRGREHDGTQLADAALTEAAVVHRLRHRGGPREAEVRRDEALQRRSRPTPVASADGGAQTLHSDARRSAPVARDVADGRKPGRPSVGCDRGSIAPLAADENDAPATVRARAQRAEAVVHDL